MAINSVQVIAPRSAPQAEAKPKEDWTEKVMKGLQIANGLLGMGVNIQSIRNNQSQMDVRDAQEQRDSTKSAYDTSEQERKARGEVTPLEEAALREKGFVDVPAGSASSTPLTRVVGEQKTPLQLAMAPKAKEAAAAKTREVTVPGPDGKPITKIVEDKAGAEFPAYRDPPKTEKPEKDITVQERNNLQNQYDRDPEVRKTKEVLNSYGSVQELLKNPSPASDQALVYAYMKALDPGSVVRESEAESAAALGGLQERAKAAYARLSGDGGMSDAQRHDMAMKIKQLAQAAAERQSSIDNQFSDLAARRKVDTQDLRFVARPKFEDERMKQQTQTPGLRSVTDTAKPATPAAGAIVEVGGKRYRVEADGDTLTEIK